MRLPERVFVTGTDTEVGKTLISFAICASDPGRVGLKPVASGVQPGTRGEDAELLGAPMPCYALREPLSPHRAAEIEGVELELPALLDWIEARSAQRMLVEGVGGWTVPLSWSVRASDLAVALGWPVLVVAADRLGVINHTLLTVEAVRASGLGVCGVVLNRLAPDHSSEHNLNDLRRLLDVPVLAFPHVVEPSQAGRAWASLSAP